MSALEEIMSCTRRKHNNLATLAISLRQAIGLAAITSLASACAPELHKRTGNHPHLVKRQIIPKVIGDTRGWPFELADEWNVLKPDKLNKIALLHHNANQIQNGAPYCLNGTQQSPLKYSSEIGLYRGAAPVFNHPESLTKSFNDWDFGPRSLLDKGTGNTNTDLPSIQFEENGETETVYFHSWHTHSPAEHSNDGWTPNAELHFVCCTAKGIPHAVVTFPIDRHPDATGSQFFSQLQPPFPDSSLPTRLWRASIATRDWWFHQLLHISGKLAPLPCADGLRWFVSTDLLLLNDVQIQELSTVNTFSARPEFWTHRR